MDSSPVPRRSEAASFDPYVEALLSDRMPELRPYFAGLDDFRSWVLTEVDAQAAYTDRYAPPALETYDRDRNVLNRIVSNPQYEAQHQECYRRGIVALPYTNHAPHTLSFTMGYLLSQADISLHCPVTLTGAVAYVLAYLASDEIRGRYLSDLIRMDGATKTGGTWATEQHGGSDVGATTTVARLNGTRATLHGLKWFTSNANGGLAVATARPEGAPPGSRGLGLYLVPSHLEDGSVNHYRIRRLKSKHGTKGLPTGEIDLLGAEAVEIAGPPQGFRVMMEALEYSRVHNAVGAAGVQRRALREALLWARSRKAFGHTLIDYPMVIDELLRMRVRYESGTLLAFEAGLAFDEALGNPERRTWLRIATALAKYLTAEDANRTARAALELIGGNAYTSDYPMSRILRDAQVLTVWEGPANIQALELLRLLAPKYSGALQYEQRLREIVDRLAPVSASLADRLQQRLKGDLEAIELTINSEDSAQRYARKLLHRLSESLGFALMCERAVTGDETRALTAIRYFEEIEALPMGSEDNRVNVAAPYILGDEDMSR